MKTNSNSTGRWIIVDDNADLLEMMRDLITAFCGVQVESFNSPAAALAAFTDEPNGFDLIITDFEMPGMNGAELCAAIKKISPSQKIFLATGSGFFTEAAERGAGFLGLLHKPFPLAELKALLARADVGETEMAFA